LVGMCTDGRVYEGLKSMGHWILTLKHRRHVWE